MLRVGIVSLALLGAAVSCFAQVSDFAANEVRSASIKDRLHGIRATLTDGTKGAKKLSAAITAAFKDADDWAPATEAYYARKRDLLKRAVKLEAELDGVITHNAPERADEVAKELALVGKKDDALRSDYEFYLKLPELAGGDQRQAAQAAMRLLGKTGDYPVALAYFLDKTPHRPPFAPLPPGVMSIRHE